MANIDVLHLPEEIKKADGASGSAGLDEGAEPKSDITIAPEASDDQGVASPASASSPASALTPLRASPANGQSSSSSTAPTLTVPHPKKFTSSNINRKFLEKTSSTSPSGQTLSASVTAKIGSSIQKPPSQAAPTHSRLVTAKLTATPQSSSTTPGWSRPPSSVSSVAPTPSAAANSKPQPIQSSSISPQPTLGKVIQPQPRGASEAFAGVVKKESSGKPVWGNARGTAAVVAKLDAVANDFPTAAEAAQGRAAKASEQKQATEAAAAQKQAVAAEEDTFRGVHLDPNAHHWDEMEEDDDNFLDGVIEFDDGRQYKVQPSDAPTRNSPPHDSAGNQEGHDVRSQLELLGPPDHPVSKEERFADDFDRSWPRSRVVTGMPYNQREQHANATSPTASSVSMHSPQEMSRVLFNERSNRLEPYSNSHVPHRQASSGPPPFMARRGSRSDKAVSPTDPRGGRDVPPHVLQQGVQLLQKPPGGDRRFDTGSHSRAFRDQHQPPALSPTENARHGDREPNASFQFPLSRTSSQGFQARSKDHYNPYGMPHLSPIGTGRDVEDRPRRTSTMGPPPLPPPPLRETGRQLPPHLGNQRSPTFSMPRAPSVPEPKDAMPSGLTAEPPSATGPSFAMPVAQSPLSTHASLSPATSVRAPLPIVVDIEDVHKETMSMAAERAKLRRKQEEEERERDKERARRKAAELEEKMKAHSEQKPQTDAQKPTVSEAQVIAVIEAAVQSIPSGKPTESPSNQDFQPPSAGRPGFARAPSTKGAPRPGPNRRTSFLAPVESSPATEVESWRSKAPRPSSSSHQTPVEPPRAPPPLLLAEIDSLDVQSGEDLEVVDFADLGRLVGMEHPPPAVAQDVKPFVRAATRPPRPVATDFFDDDIAPASALPQSARGEEGSWRRRPDRLPDQSTDIPKLSPSEATGEKATVQIVTSDPPSADVLAISTIVTESSPSRQDEPYLQTNGHHTGATHNHHAPLRSPLGPSFREAPMSALDDTMARIKGALDGLHPKEPAPAAPKLQKWLPPALRQKQVDYVTSVPGEVFDVTRSQPPRSPKPVWNVLTVKLPVHDSRRYEPVSKRQLDISRRPNARWSEVFSWSPPLMTTTPEELLFRKYFHKGRPPKYFVVIPRPRRAPHHSVSDDAQGPVVNLPPKPVTRQSSQSEKVDVQTGPSWRRIQQAETLGKEMNAAQSSSVLDTSTVNFIVSSELEDERSAEAINNPTPADVNQAAKATGEATFTNETAPPAEGTGQFLPASTDGKLDSEKSDLPPERVIITPPPSASMSPWTKSPRSFSVKESPSRHPDPEHLKAVWSHPLNKADSSSRNSLEGIADDLAAVPFTIQEVKSEDGETPPPSSSGVPPRMSSFEVARAFQTVPSPSPLGAHQGGSTLPDIGSAPQNGASRPTFAYAPPMAAANMRPPYGYPSPMMSHTPSPTVMYPHMAPSPVSRPMVMNGPPSPYGQPVWVPVPGPPSQPPGAMMRAMASPYPAQLMPYPSHGGPVPMYAGSPAAVQASLPQPSNAPQNRAPGMPMLSPVMQPAHANLPMYASSPVMMHSPAVVPVPPNHNYSGVPAGRGRRAYDQAHSHPPPQSGSYVVAPSTYGHW
ncbi:predicted protein [Postia placenta Mad-698-R]|uniref:Uncharacterized protein n=1 Tax=Postia placenta MAD-698-R-SB12 TaxID=670580 RepID=A0A1X6NGM5_9APHY|nr:hypothetical protein POSPLADRAFT_1176730 [Postia placenta MAD-698-R-SB12]EED81264.1 predicted protein [Postia placenta Mad-698-R]OSX67787.1 hypothetical protein POSPLADRAFT_1176730 [Postia placenta MAD-698-R-SB12]